MRPTVRSLIAITLPLAVLLAGCSDGGTASVEPSAAGGGGGSEAVIKLSESSLGPIVVDADGRTLYGFEEDSDGIPTCYDACAENWPPYAAAEDSVAGDGLDSAALTEFERTDGTIQALYGGWPLYYYSGDLNTGDVNGQGVGGVWWVVSADGELAIAP